MFKNTVFDFFVILYLLFGIAISAYLSLYFVLS